MARRDVETKTDSRGLFIPAAKVPDLFLLLLTTETLLKSVIDAETIDGEAVPTTDIKVVREAKQELHTCRQLRRLIERKAQCALRRAARKNRTRRVRATTPEELYGED